MDRTYSLAGQLFEWNTDKAASNLLKHGMTFEEAASVFLDEAATLVDDPDHSVGESRFVILGQSYLRRILFVVSVERENVLRIVSARLARPKERRSYESRRVGGR